jgi:hypothetical protein
MAERQHAPIGARLDRDGLGAVRSVRWQHGIRFQERITEWRPGRRIGWPFAFGDMAAWDYTDRHLLPDNPYMRVESCGYRLEPAGPGRSRPTLDTTYWMRTWPTPYAARWGELVLGDLERNVLAVVKGRAKRDRPRDAER